MMLCRVERPSHFPRELTSRLLPLESPLESLERVLALDRESESETEPASDSDSDSEVVMALSRLVRLLTRERSLSPLSESVPLCSDPSECPLA